jgi:hypothetical protein
VIKRWGRNIVAFFEGVSTIAAAITGMVALTAMIWGGSHIIPSAGKSNSGPACSDQLDNDDDGRTDFPSDPSCESKRDTSEKNPPCSDGRDNDEDGGIDYPSDRSCMSKLDPSERDVACSDGQDNDHDGRVDFDNDDGCVSANDPSEKPVATP